VHTPIKAAHYLRNQLKLLVADAVTVKLVSTAKFHANREFRRIRPPCKILKADTRAILKAFHQIPYATEQGIISAKQGILAQEQGKFFRQTGNHRRMIYSTHIHRLDPAPISDKLRVDLSRPFNT
jgi:hypothetical protein